MRGLLVAAVAGLALAGCASPYDDLLKNDYLNVVATPVDQNYVGTWTGVSSFIVMTFRIEPNGEGIACSSAGSNNSRFLLKHNNGVLYFQSGGRVDLSKAGDRLIATYPAYGMTQTVLEMVSDSDLKNAAPYCQEALSPK